MRISTNLTNELVRLVIGLGIAAVRWLHTQGALTQLMYPALVLLSTLQFGIALLILTTAAFVVSIAFPQLPLLDWFGWMVLVLIGAFAACRRLIDPGTPGSIRYKLVENYGPAASRFLTLSGVALLLALAIFRPIPTDAALRYGLTALLVGRALPRGAPDGAPRQLLKAGTFALVCAMVFLLCLEVGARMFFPLTRASDMYFTLHPEAGRTLRPGATGFYPLQVHEGVVHRIPMTISHQGLRNPELEEKMPDEFRILMLGDSFTMGAGVQDNETIPAQLEIILSDVPLSKDVTVINAGVIGYGIWQERILLEERGFPLEPDLVMLQTLTSNDLSEQLRKTDEHLAAYNVADHIFWETSKPNPAIKFRLERRLWAASAAYQQFLARTNYQFRLVYLLDALRPLDLVTKRAVPPSDPRPWSMEPLLQDWYPALQRAWDLTAAEISEIRDDCAAHDVELIAFAAPTMLYADDDLWNAQAQNMTLPLTAYDREKDVALFEQLFSELGLPWIPVGSIVRKHADPQEWYYPYDGHFNAAGCRAVAEIIADYLVHVYLPEHGPQLGLELTGPAPRLLESAPWATPLRPEELPVN